MKSDFATARLHLERASHHLCGNDQTSRKACEALDILIEAIITVQHAQPKGQVIKFPKTAR